MACFETHASVRSVHCLCRPPIRCVPLVHIAILLSSGSLSGQVSIHTPARALVRIEADKEDLSSVGLLAVNSHGVLAVQQPQDGAIRFFAKDGRPLSRIGRKGSGPGEFRALNAMGWLGDTLWIADGVSNRLTLVGANGKLLRTSPLPTSLRASAPGTPVPDYHQPVLKALFADGTLMLTARRLVSAPAGAPAGTRGVEMWTLRVTVDGELLRVIAQEPIDACFLRGGQAEAILPLCPQPASAAASDGTRRIFVTTGAMGSAAGSYQLITLNQDGDTVFTRRFNVQLEAVSSTTRDSLAKRIDSMIPPVRALVEPRGIPKYFPPVYAVRVGTDGSIWVGMRATGKAPTREWQIVDKTGNMHRSVWLPRGILPDAIDARGAWGVETSTDGIQSVVLYSGGF
jgi:hypothetical protein